MQQIKMRAVNDLCPPIAVGFRGATGRREPYIDRVDRPETRKLDRNRSRKIRQWHAVSASPATVLLKRQEMNVILSTTIA